MASISTRVAAARQRLRDAGIRRDEAALDARLLAQDLLGWDSARILTSGNDEEPAWFATRYEAAVDRRTLREPLPYITGTREFWNLPFEVSSAVLIPRPETEGLVEAVLELFPERDAPLKIVDACTGSGCVAVAIASELPYAGVLATEISEPALAVARRNAERHRVSDRVQFLRADLLAGVVGPFDAILSNPPYVPAGARPALQPEVRDFEPPIALFGGDDGLEIARRLAVDSVPRLRSGGYLIFEFGDGQEEVIRELISTTPGLTMVDARPDLQGIARIAVVRREP
jgi:release factor glutamine methyltransferase